MTPPPTNATAVPRTPSRRRFLQAAATAAAGALVAPALAGAARAARVEEALVVMSYNILVGLGPVPTWAAEADPRPTLARIAEVVREHGADLVLLQEVDRGAERTAGVDEATFLRQQLGYHGVFAPALGRSGGEYGVALLSRWPIRGHRVLPLFKPDYGTSHPELPEYFSEQRVALVAEIDAPSGPVTVVNTHLGLTREQRVHQLREIAGVLEEAAAKGPVLFGGDLNAEPDALELLPVRRLLRDCYHGFRDDRGLVENLPIRSRLTFPYDVPEVCIDYLFVSDLHFDVLRTEVLDVRHSDHRPVLAHLTCRARTG